MPAIDTTVGIDNTSGIVGKEAYSLMCANAEKVVKSANTSTLTYQAIANAFITGIGLIKQYNALEKQGELADAQRDVALRGITLSERNYNEMALPAYKKAEEYFHVYFRRQWETKLKSIAECGLKDCEYVADYARWIGRGLADVVKVVSAAKLSSKRLIDSYSAGLCCEQDYRFAELQAVLVSDTINFGRVYEDDYKLKRDQFYWNRQTTVANMIQNLGSLAANINQFGKSAVNQALSLQLQAGQGFDRAVESGFAALGQQANFYGSLGGFAGAQSGRAYGQSVGETIFGESGLFGITPVQNPTSPSYTIQAPAPITVSTPSTVVVPAAP